MSESFNASVSLGFSPDVEKWKRAGPSKLGVNGTPFARLRASQRCGNDRPQRLKTPNFEAITARLKPCSDENHL